METQRSEYILLRRELLSRKIMPQVSKVKQLFGKNFAEDVFFKQADKVSKQLIGLEPPLKGVTGDLWTSPSDLLIGKVCLKPPLTSKHIRALTHRGILEIGHDIEKKYWNEMEIDKEKALKEQEDQLRLEFDMQLRNIGLEVQREEQRRCAKEMRKLEKAFEERLEEELRLLEERLTNSSHIMCILAEQKEALDAEWQQKLDEEIEATVTEMTKRCLEGMQKQEEVMIHSFKLNLREAEARKQYALEEERNHFTTKIKQLRHKLECKNISNMMYILCMERRKCQKEKNFLLQSYETYVKELNRSIEQRDGELENLGRQLGENEIKLNLREQCLTKILEQYQKFINYALKATPTQAEFLLDMEKLLMYELTDTLAKKPEIVESPEELIACGKVVPWIIQRGSDSILGDQGSEDALIAKDHHDCFNETDLPPDQRQTSDVLPMFYYNKKMYVREDFRNRFSHEVKMSPSNDLWNEDVESLINILKKSVHKDSSTLLIVDSFDKKDKLSRGSGQPSKQTSSVHFTTSSWPDDEDSRKGSVASGSGHFGTASKRKASLKVKESDMLVDFNAIGREEKRKTLISAKNSLELFRKSASKCAEMPYITETIQEDADEAEETEEKPAVEYIECEKVLLINNRLQTEEKAVQTDDVDDESEIFGTVFEVTRNSSSPTELTSSTKAKEKRASIAAISEHSSKLALAKDSVIMVKETNVQKAMEDILETKVLVAKDSFTITKGSTASDEKHIGAPRSCLKLSIENINVDEEIVTPKMSNTPSKLMQVRDSIEIMRGSLKSLHDKGSEKNKQTRSMSKGSELEVVKGITVPDHNDDVDTLSVVHFINKPIVCDFQDKKVPKMYTSISKPEPVKQRDNFLKKKNKLKIVGNSKAIEQTQTSEEFTNERIKSLISLIKDSPDLISMFTSFSR